MSERLRLHLGRRGPKSVDAEQSAIEATGDFVIEIHNHGHPLHVHVAPEDDLGRFVSIDATNHYIEEDALRTVSARVADDRPKKFDGKLRIVTGYGHETSYVTIKLREERTTDRSVAVDESLARPRSEEPTGVAPVSKSLLGSDAIPILALAGMAVLIAIGATMIASDVAVVVGVLAVLLGVGIAVLLMVR